MNTRKGPVVAVPYALVINDVAIYAVAQHSSDEIIKRGRDQYDRLSQEGAKIPRIIAISVLRT